MSCAHSAGDTAIQVTPAAPLKTGETVTWTLHLQRRVRPKHSGDSSPPIQPALRFASIGDPVSYLLYPARWFPMTGYLTDRFTMAIHVHVPAGEHVFGSGLVGAPHSGSERLDGFRFRVAAFWISGNHHRGQISRAVHVQCRFKCARLSHRQSRGARRSMAKNIATTANQEIQRFHSAVRSGGSRSAECRRTAGRYSARILGAGDCGDCRRADEVSDCIATAGQHHRPPMVGERCKPGNTE